MRKVMAFAIIVAMSIIVCACGNAGTPQDQAISANLTTAQSDSSSSVSIDQDDRGIAGMESFAIRQVLSSSPFNIAVSDPTQSVDQAYCAETCSSIGRGDGPYTGIDFDYSLSIDADGEIVGASFGVGNMSSSSELLLSAADLCFYAVSRISYDTSDPEELSAWFEDNLSAAGSDAICTTVGDASYELYGIPGDMYWVNISKEAK